MYWDFTGHALPEHKDQSIIDMLTALKSGKAKLTREEKNRLPQKGVYKKMGWLYDFRSVLNKYVVKTEHYLEEVYAFDKTAARHKFKGLGRVIYIVEVPK